MPFVSLVDVNLTGAAFGRAHAVSSMLNGSRLIDVDPVYLRNTRRVGDFTRWKDHDSYRKAYERLLRGLKAGA